jgi:hypothetical protein
MQPICFNKFVDWVLIHDVIRIRGWRGKRPGGLLILLAL